MPLALQSNVVSAAGETAFFDPATETLDRQKLKDLQLRRVQDLLQEILPRNAFYARCAQRRFLLRWNSSR